MLRRATQVYIKITQCEWRSDMPTIYFSLINMISIRKGRLEKEQKCAKQKIPEKPPGLFTSSTTGTGGLIVTG